MSRWRTCARAGEMLRNVRLGAPLDRDEHLRTCVVCREALTIAEFFRKTAEPELEDLPDPNRIYWRAVLLQRRALAERATRPIRWIQQTAWVATIVLGLMAAVGVWRLPSPVSRLTHLWSSAPAEPQFLGAVMIGFAMMALSVAIGWWAAAREDG